MHVVAFAKSGRDMLLILSDGHTVRSLKIRVTSYKVVWP